MFNLSSFLEHVYLDLDWMEMEVINFLSTVRDISYVRFYRTRLLNKWQSYEYGKQKHQ